MLRQATRGHMRIGSFTWWFLIIFLIMAGTACWWQRSRVPTTPLSSSITSNTQERVHNESAPTPSPLEKPLSIIFVGDIMLDRNIRTFGEKQGYGAIIDPELCKLLAEADLVVGNLEGPVTDEPSISQGSVVGSPANYRFTFSPESLSALKECDINVVSLGNNHSNDFGAEGKLSTIAAVDAANILRFGDTGPETSEQDAVLIWSDARGAIGFVNFNQFVPGSFERTLARMEAVRDSVDYLVVFTHWGIEYQTSHNTTLQAQARELSDAGADLIIGTHPHVIAPSEIIGTTPVYYSLGNFIFDQYFSEEVRAGLIVKASLPFPKQSISTDELRVLMKLPGITELQEE